VKDKVTAPAMLPVYVTTHGVTPVKVNVVALKVSALELAVKERVTVVSTLLGVISKMPCGELAVTLLYDTENVIAE